MSAEASQLNRLRARRTIPCRTFFLALLAALAMAGCNMPADPEHTLESVRGGQMRIGVIDNPPWVVRQAEARTVGGLEAQLMQDFALQLDAEIEWVPGSEAELMTALEHFQLDAVIGGLTDRSPWIKNISFSRPYHSSSINVAMPAGAAQVLTNIKGLEIAVASGSEAAAHVHAKGGKAVPVRALDSARLPIAAPEWRLRALGLLPGIELHRQRHVIALSPGENAWLVAMDRFLHDREGEIPALLDRAARESDQGPDAP